MAKKAAKAKRADPDNVVIDDERLRSKGQRLIAEIPGFAEGMPPPLDEEKFYSQVVPLFEAARDEFITIVKRDNKLVERVQALRLVVADNRATGDAMIFWLTDKYHANAYVRGEHAGLRGFAGFKSKTINMWQCCKVNILNALRWVFVDELLSRAKPEDIAFYVEAIIKWNYHYIHREHTDAYYLFRIQNLQFWEEGSTITGYRINLVIPIASRLTADEIPDSSWAPKKVIFTNRRDTSGYAGFDRILGFDELHSDIGFTRFVHNMPFMRRLVPRLNTAEVYEAMEYLRTSGFTETFPLKLRLATVAPSAGQPFEDCVESILRTCFENCYEKFHMERQVPNRGRTTIRDFIIRNRESTHPFLKSLEARGVELLLFDAKNYGKPLRSSDLDRMRTYLGDNRAFGNFGVILSKNGMNKNCNESVFRASLAESRQTILVLDESGMLLMLDKFDQELSAADVLSDKYHEFSLQA